jgi:hypothetical protein
MLDCSECRFYIVDPVVASLQGQLEEDKMSPTGQSIRTYPLQPRGKPRIFFPMMGKLKVWSLQAPGEFSRTFSTSLKDGVGGARH